MAGIVQTELQIIEAQSMLDVKSARTRQGRKKPTATAASRCATACSDRREFKKDPDVLALKQEIDDTREHLDRIKRNVRQAHDPARVAAQKQFDKLQQEYDDLWKSKYPEILGRLTGDPVGDTQSLASIQELEQKIDSLKKGKEKQTELFKVMEVDQKSTNNDTFDAGYLNYQLNSLLHWEEPVKKHLAQLMFEDSHE